MFNPYSEIWGTRETGIVQNNVSMKTKTDARCTNYRHQLVRKTISNFMFTTT